MWSKQDEHMLQSAMRRADGMTSEEIAGAVNSLVAKGIFEQNEHGQVCQADAWIGRPPDEILAMVQSLTVHEQAVLAAYFKAREIELAKMG